MGKDSGGAKSKSVSSSQPWTAQQPYLKDLFARAQGIANQPLQYFPDSTVAERNPYTEQALTAQARRGLAGSDLNREAQSYTQAVLSGEHLGSNPWLDQMYDRAAKAVSNTYNRTVLPGIETRFAGANRSGSDAYQRARRIANEELGDSLGGLATSIYGGAYEAERSRMGEAMRAAPTLAMQDYVDTGQAAQAGLSQEQLAQRQLDDLVKRFQFNQDEPFTRASRYAALLGQPIMTSQSYSKQWNESDPTKDIAAGVLALAPMAFGMPPMPI